MKKPVDVLFLVGGLERLFFFLNVSKVTGQQRPMVRVL